jgi:hypothetical protein
MSEEAVPASPAGAKRRVLSAQEILTVQDIPVVEVNVPEWGGIVRIRGISGEEATQFAESQGKGKGDSLAKMVALAVVDEDGNRLFQDSDIPALKRKSMRAMLRIQAVALDINGLSDEAKAEAKNG